MDKKVARNCRISFLIMYFYFSCREASDGAIDMQSYINMGYENAVMGHGGRGVTGRVWEEKKYIYI